MATKIIDFSNYDWRCLMKAMKRQQNTPNHNRQFTTRGVRLCLASLLIAVGLVGCKPQEKAVADANPAGTYALVSVDGNKVPCAVNHDGASLTIKSGVFVFNPEGTCSSKMDFTTPQGKDASREVKASYTREGSKLTMNWEGAGITSGSVEGNTFTMTNEGMVLAYQK
jgi:hypothetical protein